MTKPFRALVALAGVAAFTLAGISPATAARWSHKDAVGDVLSQTDTFDEETGDLQEGEPTLVPDNTDTDITRVSVAHRSRSVVLTTKLRDITGKSGVVVYEIRTGKRTYSVMQRLGKGRTFPAFLLERANGNRVRCTGVQHKVDRTADRATVKIPRQCLGSPRWVRVGAGAVKFEGTDTEFTFLVDVLQGSALSDKLVLSPKVRRG